MFVVQYLDICDLAVIKSGGRGGGFQKIYVSNICFYVCVCK